MIDIEISFTDSIFFTICAKSKAQGRHNLGQQQREQQIVVGDSDAPFHRRSPFR
jgi:hypothetical protein